jgi:hypothetical protein
MIELAAFSITCLVAGYFIVLGTAGLIAPSVAKRFLLGFASSASAHYSELLIRLMVGAALLIHAPKMLYADVFNVFGWLLIVTSVMLLPLPWRWHQRFVGKSVPQALRYLPVIGLCALAFGILLIVALARGTSG